jgi:hypothetical protein
VVYKVAMMVSKGQTTMTTTSTTATTTTATTTTTTTIPRPESASELYRPSDRCLSAEVSANVCGYRVPRDGSLTAVFSAF